MKYRIEKIDYVCSECIKKNDKITIKGQIKTHYKIAIKHKFLFITWWKYASKTVGSMSEVWSEPLCFDTYDDAIKYYEEKLNPKNKCKIIKTIL